MFSSLNAYIDQNKAGTQKLGQQATGAIGQSVQDAQRQLQTTQPQQQAGPSRMQTLQQQQAPQQTQAPSPAAAATGNFAQREFKPQQPQMQMPQLQMQAPMPKQPTLADQAMAQTQGGVQFDQALFDEAQSNPVEFAKDPSKVARLQSMMGAQYAGPNSLEESSVFGDLIGKIDAAKAKAEQPKTFAGTQQLAEEFQKSKDRSVGRSQFDAFLLGGNKDTASALRDASATAGALDPQLESAKKAFGAKAEEAKKAAELTRSKATNAAKTMAEQFQANMSEKLTKAQAERQALNQSIIKALQNSGDLTPEQQTALGISPEQYAQMRNAFSQQTDLSQFANLGDPSQLGAGDIASEDDRARQAAIQSITGMTGALGQGQQVSNTFNFDGALQALKTKALGKKESDAAAAQKKAEQQALAQIEKEKERQKMQKESKRNAVGKQFANTFGGDPTRHISDGWNRR